VSEPTIEVLFSRNPMGPMVSLRATGTTTDEFVAVMREAVDLALEIFRATRGVRTGGLDD
jgi:hypothetical protein